MRTLLFIAGEGLVEATVVSGDVAEHELVLSDSPAQVILLAGHLLPPNDHTPVERLIGSWDRHHSNLLVIRCRDDLHLGDRDVEQYAERIAADVNLVALASKRDICLTRESPPKPWLRHDRQSRKSQLRGTNQVRR